MNDIKFERLTLDNIAFINDELIMDEDKYNIEDLKNFVSNNNNYIFIGRDSDKVVANLYGYGLNRPDGKYMFYIHSVDVLKEYQGKKIGTKLMEYTLNYIKSENKYYKFFVLTEDDNIRACKLYQKYALQKEQVLFSNEL